MSNQRRTSLIVKLNLFVLSIIMVIIISGCGIAVSIFSNIYEGDVTRSVTRGIDALHKQVTVVSAGQLSRYVDNVSKMTGLGDGRSADEISKYFDSSVKPQELNSLSFIRIVADELVVADHVTEGWDILKLADATAAKHKEESFTWFASNGQKALYVFSCAPIRDHNGLVIGSVLAGQKISSEDFIGIFSSHSDLFASVFAENMRVVSTLDTGSESPVGQLMDSAVSAVVLGKGETHSGHTTIMGKPYIAAYYPITDPDGKPVGAIGVAQSMDSVNTIRDRIVLSITVLGSILFVVFFFVSNRWLRAYISKPFLRIIGTMEHVAQGNYDFALPSRSESKEIVSLYASLETMVGEISAKNKKLETIAFVDPLTGLLNRAYLSHTYEQQPLTKNPRTLTALLYIDIDNLKYINTLYSHKVGDLLLTQIGGLFAQVVTEHPGYEVFRIAGDEFAFCKEGPCDKAEVIQLARDLIQLFDRQFEIDTLTVLATVSIGISVCNYCEGNRCTQCTGVCKKGLESLLKEAEICMYSVKETGKNNYLIFDPQMSAKLEHKAVIQQELKAAIKHKELLVYYQPKHSVTADRFSGFEALVRWRHPEKGLIPPSEFIPIAEESTLIIDIGELVLREACTFIKEFNDTHHTEYSVAVNVSSMQLLSDNFIEVVQDTLKTTALAPELLELEITESLFIHSMDEVVPRLDYLRSLGIGIALDDFGTGYSSLTYLRVLPLTTVKIDKSFVDDIVHNPQAKNIVGNIIKIAKEIGLQIVAEGIETAEQMEIIKNLRCDMIQGYYYSKPLPQQEVTQLLGGR